MRLGRRPGCSTSASTVSYRTGGRGARGRCSGPVRAHVEAGDSKWAPLVQRLEELGVQGEQSLQLPVERRRPPAEPVGDDDLAVAGERLDVLPHPSGEVVLMQLGADDGFVHLAQLAQREGLGEEPVGVGMDVDVAVADLVALAQGLDRGRDDLVVVEQQTPLADEAAVGETGTRSPVASAARLGKREGVRGGDHPAAVVAVRVVEEPQQPRSVALRGLDADLAAQYVVHGAVDRPPLADEAARQRAAVRVPRGPGPGPAARGLFRRVAYGQHSDIDSDTGAGKRVEVHHAQTLARFAC